MYNIAIQHGGEWSPAEVFRATTLLFRGFGNREFVALELSEYIKRLATFGPSNRLEAARELLARLAIR